MLFFSYSSLSCVLDWGDMRAIGTAVLIQQDHDIRGLLGHVCQRAGITAHATGDGLSGIRAVEEHRPDVIILDYELPDIDGLEVARRIRETSSARIVMLTALPYEVAAHYRAAGIDAFFGKPFSVRELLRSL